MFAYLKGTLVNIGLHDVVLDINGVGYAVYVPTSIIQKLPQLGEQVKLYICFVIREDAQTLFGFIDREEKDLFEKLMAVAGIGPKAALAVLSAITPSRLVMAIAAGDDKVLTSVPGIGKKTAQRMILELKDKIHHYIRGGVGIDLPIHTNSGSIESEAVQALVALGYEMSEAYAAVQSINGVAKDVSSVIRMALKTFDRRQR